MADIRDYISVPEAADIIGCTEGRVRQLIYAEKLKAIKPNSAWLVLEKAAREIARHPSNVGRPRISKKQA